MHKRKIIPILVIVILVQFKFPLVAQEKASDFRIQLDSRRTFVDRESVGIFGIRAGFSFNDKHEAGIGLYGSRVLDFLGKRVEKNYKDNSVYPAVTLPAEVGFEYVSVFYEYTIVDSDRWMVTVNNQFGVGRVNIYLMDGNTERKIKENKTLTEHSVKAKYGVLPWLKLVAGIGYRYLWAGEEQIKKAFNAPILIMNAEIDLKKLKMALKKKD